MRYRVIHSTTYSSIDGVSVGHNEAWLQPRDLPTQRCDDFDLKITPIPSIRSTRIDYFGNSVAQFSFNQGYRELEVAAQFVATLQPRPVGRGSPSPPWESIATMMTAPRTPTALQALEFAFDSPRVRRSDLLGAYARLSFRPRLPIVTALADLLVRFQQDFKFDATATTVTTPLDIAFQQRRGVCQDFAHVLIGMLRSLGLAARYVGGYVRTQPPEGKPRLAGADASHAWVSVYCGDLGWIDIDPTNNAFADQEHITVAWGRDYADVVPIKGVVIGGGRTAMKVAVDVMPQSE